MGLFLNRKSSGMVLAGVVLGSSVISAASQGVVGAVPQDKVNDYLESCAGEGAQSLDSSVVNYLKKHWKGISVALGLIVLAGLIIRKAFFSKKEGNVVDLKKEGNFVDLKKEGNAVNLKERKFDLVGFDGVFCFEKEPENIEGLGKKLSSFLGRVFTVKVGELMKMQFLDADSSNRFKNIVDYNGYKDEDKLTVQVEQVDERGVLYVKILDEKNKSISIRQFFTKYADAGKLGSFADYLDGKDIEVNFNSNSNSNLVYN